MDYLATATYAGGKYVDKILLQASTDKKAKRATCGIYKEDKDIAVLRLYNLDTQVSYVKYYDKWRLVKV